MYTFYVILQTETASFPYWSILPSRWGLHTNCMLTGKSPHAHATTRNRPAPTHIPARIHFSMHAFVCVHRHAQSCSQHSTVSIYLWFKWTWQVRMLSCISSSYFIISALWWCKNFWHSSASPPIRAMSIKVAWAANTDLITYFLHCDCCFTSNFLWPVRILAAPTSSMFFHVM